MPGTKRHPGTSLETIIIFSSRMDKLAAFYSAGLGIGPYQTSPGHLGCMVGSVYFGVDQVDEQSTEARDLRGVTIWFTVDDIHASFRSLVELGAQVRYPPTTKPWGAVLASLEDLDGNIFGISQRLERADD